MQLFSWLHKQMTGRPQTRRTSVGKPRASFRPRLEVLEGREVPSTLTVTRLADSGKGSLRYEIAQAQSGDTIVFDKKLNGGTIQLRSDGELAINKNLTIQGPGAGLLTIDGGGNQGSRIFDIGAKATVDLEGLTLRNGDGRAINFALNDRDGEGGAILNLGQLRIGGCTVSGNSATSTGAASGGGIFNDTGALTVIGCTISGNTAGWGGGIYNNMGTVSVSSSTLSGNAAVFGGGIYNGGTLTITGSNLIGNTAQYYGGGIYNVAFASVSTSTLAGDKAADGGGILNAGAMTVSACTLYSDSATDLGGGIYNAATLTISGSVFSLNSPDNVYGPYTNGGGTMFA